MLGGMARLTVVSDSHLSTRTPEADDNWTAVLAHVSASRPDLVVHAGDLSLDGAHGSTDLEFARSRLDRLTIGWLAVPGNHDVGDNPWPGHDSISDQSRDRWLATVGQDRWTTDLDGWRLIGINAQLLDSGLAAEADQWAWLESQVDAADRVALVLHKPITDDEDELADSPGYRYVPPGPRRRLLDLIRSAPIDLVISGHVHQHRQLEFDGVRHAWAPTSWALLPENAQRTIGVKQCGVLSVELDGPAAHVEFVEPPGLRQLTMTENIPNPYAR